MSQWFWKMFHPGGRIPAAWGNRVTEWIENQESASPQLLIHPTPKGQVFHLELAETTNPWKITAEDDEGTMKASVAGGRVYDGTADYTAVAALGDVAVPTGGLCIWVEVKQYNDASTPDECMLKTGTAWPTDDYQLDTVPAAAGPVAWTGWCVRNWRVGTVAGDGTTVQMLLEDVTAIRGLTASRQVQMSSTMTSTEFRIVTTTEIYVAGVLASVGDPVSTLVAALGPCPEES
jgi:hypothetical protein